MRDAESAHNRVETNLTYRYSIITLVAKNRPQITGCTEYINRDKGQGTHDPRVIVYHETQYTREIGDGKGWRSL
jgi:hypothetical protein